MADQNNNKKYTIWEVQDILHNDSGARLIPVDSLSEEEDLLQQELDPDHSSDSDYKIPSLQRYLMSVLLLIIYWFGVKLAICLSYYPAMNL